MADQALEIDQTDARAHLAAAWASFMLGDHDKARFHRGVAVRQNPYDSFLLASTALLHALDDEMGAALELLQNSLAATLLADQHVLVAFRRYTLPAKTKMLLLASDLVDGSLRIARAWRAASCYNLGLHAEARQAADIVAGHARENWLGGRSPSVEMVGDWLTSCFPVRNSFAQERFRRGITGAGLL